MQKLGCCLWFPHSLLHSLLSKIQYINSVKGLLEVSTEAWTFSVSRMSHLQENCISFVHGQVLRGEKRVCDRKVLKAGETLPAACQELVVGLCNRLCTGSGGAVSPLGR
jgi:hypothetical protein